MEFSFIPKYFINSCIKTEQAQIDANILLSSLFLLIFIFIFFYLDFNFGIVPHFCLFEEFLGIPCPGCNVSKSIFLLHKRDVAKSLEVNMAGVAILGFVLLQIPLRAIALIKPKTSKTISNLSKNGSFLVLSILIFEWLLNFL